MSSGASASGVANQGEGKGFVAWALTARGVVVVWCTYVVAAAIVRYSLSHTLANDDVTESLLVQTFQLGYRVNNPPLWEWLLWTLQQAVGPGYESHWLLRYGCIALFGIAIFRASRIASGDVRWSAVVTLSSPMFYQIGWPFFEWGTHTLVMFIVCLFSLEVVIRYATRPTARLAIILGVLVGLGVLSKFGFALFAVCVFLTLLVRRETRHAVLRREFLLVPLVAVIVLSPFLYWVVETQVDLAAMAQKTLVREAAPHFERSLFGLKKLLENSVEFLMPWALIAAFAIWMGRRAGLRTLEGAGFGEKILGTLLLVSVGLTTVGVIAIGPTNFSSGYVVPVLVAAFPYSACLLSRHIPDRVGAERFAVISISVLVAIVLLRLAYLSNSGYPEFSYRREMWPIADLAGELREAGFDNGTLVTIGGKEAGNLHLELPELRIVTAGQNDRSRPPVAPEDTSACRLLWNDTMSIAPGLRWARTRDAEGVEKLPQVAERERHHFDIPWAPTYLGSARTSRWVVVELDPDDMLCR